MKLIHILSIALAAATISAAPVTQAGHDPVKRALAAVTVKRNIGNVVPRDVVTTALEERQVHESGTIATRQIAAPALIGLIGNAAAGGAEPQAALLAAIETLDLQSLIDLALAADDGVVGANDALLVVLEVLKDVKPSLITDLIAAVAAKVAGAKEALLALLAALDLTAVIGLVTALLNGVVGVEEALLAAILGALDALLPVVTGLLGGLLGALLGILSL